MKKYFRVKYGFGALDSVSIEEKDLKKAIYAQSMKKPVQLGESFINGSNIISIAPDFHKYTGWSITYEPKDSEDLVQIQRDCPNFDGVLEYHTQEVREIMKTGQLQKLSEESEYKPLNEHNHDHLGFLTDGINKL